jgi:hypothetical protein
MSKIEYNPRKRKHVDFLHTMIMELHTEIFHASFALVQNYEVYDSSVFRKELLYERLGKDSNKEDKNEKV